MGERMAMLILFQREKFSGARALVGSLGQLFFDDYDEHKHTEEYDARLRGRTSTVS